ncbi:MAG: CoB--CoM heterodisulfide reductase iron-sulfur subunit A family protein [Promethearchaeota archaeon]
MSDKDIRIGVFVCHCGSNIGGIIDVPQVAEYAKSLPNVVFSQDNLYTCSETGLSAIKKGIKDNNLNRVIVASCTPRTHEPLFRGICAEMGVNPYYFTFVNIREQDSWVHMKEPKAALEKAKILVRMGVARVALLEPLENFEVDVTPSTLVIGGGIAGMTAALTIADQGFQVFLVEREKILGGLLNKLHSLFHDHKPEEVLKIREKIKKNSNITLFVSSKIKDVNGYIGNYEVTVTKENKDTQFKVGTVIIATGAQVYKPKGMYGYGEDDKVITHIELEQLLKNGKITSKDNLKNIVIIQCVGSRMEGRMYCSTVCCMTALKNALILKQMFPEANIAIIYRDMYTPRTYHEEFYRKVREEMVTFLRYTPENPPKIENGKVKLYHQYYKDYLEMDYDLVVLSTPIVANDDSIEIAQMLKVPLEENGFFLEKHVKLSPVDFATDGVFLCGITKWPGNISETVTQADAAAGRALNIISKPTVEVEGATAEIDADKCIGCEVCIKTCPYSAISKDEEDNVFVNEILCKGCGLCSATCPQMAIKIKHYTNEQILAEIAASIGGGN